MGWAGGSVLCEDLIGILVAEVPDAGVRLRVCRKVIDAFEGNDCDTLGDCQGWTGPSTGRSGRGTRAGSTTRRRSPRMTTMTTMTTSRDGQALLDAILDEPEDDLPRLAYADWLEEQGDGALSERALLIRCQLRTQDLYPGRPCEW